MKLQGNTLLITGGGSGIGLALAEKFKELGNEVIVAGRSPARLETAKAKGLHAIAADVGNEAGVRALAAHVLAQFPALNVVIHNAGIMVNEKLTGSDNSKTSTEMVSTNLLGPIILTNALLPHLLQQPSATIFTVTSGLAFVPLALTPTYSATKAALHSYTQSLRYQLQGTNVEVKELPPPYVRTSLMGERQANDPHAMPLEDFIDEVFALLREHPDAEEIVVEPAKLLRFAGMDKPAHDAVFKQLNDRLMSARKAEWDAL